MPQFINFYENIAEARLRLLNTIVAYDGAPCYVHAISEHEDGRFRIYVEFFGVGGYGIGRDKYHDFPNSGNYNNEDFARVLDAWIQKNPNSGVVRKFMSAAAFNKYRPFPLGNVNYNGEVVYVERRPTRQTIQGIRSDSIICEKVSASLPVETDTFIPSPLRTHIDLYSSEFVDCVKGSYPTYQEVYDHLTSPECGNAGVAFHREFSVVRGPVKTLFLCYKTDGVGIIGAGGGLVLDSSYDYLKEQIEELNVFPYINLG